MKYMTTIITCALLLGVSIASEQKDNDLMPEGFEQIHLGMTWGAVILIRPNVEIFSLMPDPNEDLKPDPQNPKPGLIEQLTSGIFTQATYFFEYGVLVNIMFGREENDTSSVERKKLLGRVAEKRGMPSHIEIMEKEKDQGVLTWEDQSTQVNVIAPVSEAKTKRGVLGLQIMERKYAQRIRALGSSGKKGSEVSQTGDDILKANALQEEVRGLLSGMNKSEKK
jgi:hypothetical protein